jgi:hypothetical protein
MSLIKNEKYKAAMHDSVELGRGMQRLLWSKSLDHGTFGFEFAVSYVLFLRAERSLASIRVLVRHGLNDDAMALVRVMVEKIITAEYILLVGMEPTMDFIQFQAFSEWRTYQELKERNPALTPSYTDEQLKKLEAAHDKAKIRITPDGPSRNRYGRGHDWTELSLLKRAEKVDALLKKRHLVVATCFMFDASYKKSAEYLHSSFASVARSIERSGDKRKTPDGSGKVELDVDILIRDSGTRIGVDALKAANVAAFQMLAFLVDVLKHKKSRQWALQFAAKKAPRSRSNPVKSQNPRNT